MNENLIQRSFFPGDECIFFKIYCSERVSDTLLSGVIKDLSVSQLEMGHISKWFFVRYYDPNPHLRLRYFINRKETIGALICDVKNLLQDFINQGLVWRIQIDSYERELERYGKHNIENLEYIFFKESTMVIDVLNHLSNEQVELANDLKWKTCSLAIDTLLTGLQFNLKTKAELLRFLSSNFFMEFNDRSTLKDKLSQKYRENKIGLSQFLNENDSLYHKAVEAYSEGVILHLKSIKQQNTAKNEFFNLCGSLIHMLCNRFFRSRQRLFELVIYDIMFKYYQSLLLRTIKEGL